MRLLLKESRFIAARVQHQYRSSGAGLLRVKAVSEISLDGLLMVDQISLKALQIFHVSPDAASIIIS